MTKSKGRSTTTTTSSRNRERMLTETELELMTILWRIGEGSVADVIGRLSPGRELAYTSVSTILRILEQKGFLETRKEGRGHIYIPLLARHEYEARAVKDVVQRVFDGTPLSLVKQLLDSVPMNPSEIEELKRLLARAESKK